MTAENVLTLNRAGKEYRIYDKPSDRLKSLVTGRQYYRSHWALKDISFNLKRGQCMGVVGDNGAGKSSLLKLIAGTLSPSCGTVNHAGRITAILELGAGFHPEFSGRDNLFFAGSLIGINAEKMTALLPSIVEFSELGASLDRPVKTYSSGMVVRLAFSLVTAVEPDVLVVDEALAVGDQHFQKKCIERIDQFRRNGCTILFCSHSLYHVRHLCNVAIWMEKGQIQAYGETEPVLAAYEAHVRKQDELSNISKMGSTAQTKSQVPHNAEAAILEMTVENLGQGNPPLLESPHLTVKVTARTVNGECPSMGVMLEQLHGTGITTVATHTDGLTPHRQSDGLWRITLIFPDLPLHSGEYVLSAYLADSQGLVMYDQWHQHQAFTFVNPSMLPGLVKLPHNWA